MTATVAISERFLNRDKLSTLPRPEPFINGTVDLSTVVVVAGSYGSLKSFLVLDWAACAATGFAWNGRSVEPGRVLYVAAEGAHGLDQRLNAWEQHRKTVIPSDQLVVLPEPVNLLDAPAVAELAAAISSGGFRFVVIDTLAKCLLGADENSSRDMGMAVAALYLLRKATKDGGTVIIVHHTGKDRTTIRGSSALEAGVDCVYKAEGDPGGTIQLSRTKRKDGPVEDVHSFSFESVDGTDSGVIQSHEGVRLTGRSGTLLSHYQSHFSETGASPAQLLEGSGMARATFFRALNDLVKGRSLVNVGSEKRPFYKEANR